MSKDRGLIGKVMSKHSRVTIRIELSAGREEVVPEINTSMYALFSKLAERGYELRWTIKAVATFGSGGKS